MPSKYKKINDLDFENGIQFQCKYIGSMDISRPTSRVEIVAAMRRVRFEFKQKGIKKKKVTLTISTDGIRTRASARKVSSKKKYKYKDNPGILIESHPIYRIFYVSHDSQDVKIFSYIARDSNSFHCVVFKARKKAQAMKIVRTVGQAFEVCHHEVSTAGDDYDKQNEDLDDKNEKLVDRESVKDIKEYNDKVKSKQQVERELVQDEEIVKLVVSEYDKGVDKEFVKECDKEYDKPKPNRLQLDRHFVEDENLESASEFDKLVDTELDKMDDRLETQYYEDKQEEKQLSQESFKSIEINLLKQKLEMQRVQTEAALSQIEFLKNQLMIEQRGRVEAQARTQQLLLHNKELLDHLQSLVSHINGPVFVPQLSCRSKIERWFQQSRNERGESGFFSEDNHFLRTNSSNSLLMKKYSRISSL